MPVDDFDCEKISDELFRARVPNLVGRTGQPTNTHFIGRRHGPSVINGNERINQYVERRESREREIFAAVDSGLDTSEVITALIYPEVLPNIRRAAEGTVRAHLIHLVEQGCVHALDDRNDDQPRYVVSREKKKGETNDRPEPVS